MRSLLRKHWMILGISVSCLLGLGWPALGLGISGYLSFLVGTLMFMMGLGTGYESFSQQVRRWRETGIFLLLSYGLASILACGLGWLLFGNRPALYAGLILVGTTSTTLSSCVIYTRLAGGNGALALWFSVNSSLLCAFVSPPLIALALGRAVSIPVLELMQKLLLVLALPVSAGMLVRKAVGESRVEPWGGAITKSGAVIVLTVLMVSVALNRGILLAWTSLPVLFAAAVLHILLVWSAWLMGNGLKMPARDKTALIFCAGQKTLPIPVYLAISVLGLPGASLPPLLHHLFQLTADSVLVSFLAARNKPDTSHKG